MNFHHVIRLIITIALVAFILVLVKRLNLPSCYAVQTYFEAMGWQAVIFFALSYALGAMLLLPAAFFLGIGGLVFGPWLGLVYGTLAVALGISVPFLLSRYLARGYLQNMVRKKSWFPKLEQYLTGAGFSTVFLLRIFPVVPYSWFSYACGILPVRPVPFVLGSILGMFPGIVTYTYIGYAAGCAFLKEDLDLPATVQQNVAIILVLRIAIAVVAFRLMKKKYSEVKLI